MIASFVSWGSAGKRVSDEGAVLRAGHPGVGGVTEPCGGEDRSAVVPVWEGHLKAGRDSATAASHGPGGCCHTAETGGAGTWGGDTPQPVLGDRYPKLFVV